MRVLCVYASHHGQTEKIAQRMAVVWRRRGHVADVVAVDPDTGVHEPALASADAVVVCAPVYVGGHPPAIRRFVVDHREALEGVPSAFVSVGLWIASADPVDRAAAQANLDRFLVDTGWRPRRTLLAAGALTYSRYDVVTRLVMLASARRSGHSTDVTHDHEYTDWGAVERFAESLLPAKAESGAAVAAPRS